MAYGLNEILDVGDRAHVYYCGVEGLHTSVVPERNGLTLQQEEDHG